MVARGGPVDRSDGVQVFDSLHELERVHLGVGAGIEALEGHEPRALSVEVNEPPPHRVALALLPPAELQHGAPVRLLKLVERILSFARERTLDAPLEELDVR